MRELKHVCRGVGEEGPPSQRFVYAHRRIEAVAILVDAVVGNVDGARIDGGIVVIAVTFRGQLSIEVHIDFGQHRQIQGDVRVHMQFARRKGHAGVQVHHVN